MLKAREERFCLEYIIDYKAGAAALRAGYGEGSKNPEKAASNAATKLLKKEEVAARIRELQEEFNKAHCFDEKSRVLKELWATYDKATAAEPVMAWDYDEHKMKPTGEYCIDGKTATKSLELIAKMSGMLTDNVKADLSTDKIEMEISVVK